MRSGLFIIPGIATPIMLWMTRGESAGLYRILDDIADQMLPKSEMAEMAENIKSMRAEINTESKKTGKVLAEIKTESEKTRGVLGSIAGTLEDMNKTLKSIDGKLDRIPGPPEPVTLPTGTGGSRA